MKDKDIRNRTYGEDIENMFAPVSTLPRPAWFEGQTIFKITPERIVWKNNVYVKAAHFFSDTLVVEENTKKFTKKYSITKNMLKSRAKDAAVDSAIWILVLILVILLK